MLHCRGSLEKREDAIWRCLCIVVARCRCRGVSRVSRIVRSETQRATAVGLRWTGTVVSLRSTPEFAGQLVVGGRGVHYFNRER